MLITARLWLCKGPQFLSALETSFVLFSAEDLAISCLRDRKSDPLPLRLIPQAVGPPPIHAIPEQAGVELFMLALFIENME